MDTNKSDNKTVPTNLEVEEQEEKIKPLVILLIIVFGVWMLSYVLIYISIEQKNQGTFGDTFGAINSLFSGLAIAGIIYTILMQRKELRLQRKELMETRKELRRSAEAQERSE